MENINVITINDVKPGDMLLYVLNEKPVFLPFTKENAWANFGILIDRLIIAMEGSMCTHAALAASTPNTVVEATLPYCQYRTGIWAEGFSVYTKRVVKEGKGDMVLKFLPSGIKPGDPSENLPYAYAQSVTAALLCLFRRKMPDNPIERDLLLIFLQLILHPLAKKIDDFISSRQDKDGSWFCSQLVTYCYDQAAKVDPDYTLKFPNLFNTQNTIVDWLESNNKKTLSSNSSITNILPVELTEDIIFFTGTKLLSILEKSEVNIQYKSFVNTELTKNFESLVVNKNKILADSSYLLETLTNKKSGSKKINLQEYKESLIMPSDLLNESALEVIGIINENS